MSADSAERRFDATPARRERAKRDGNAAHSHELSAIAAFAAALAGTAGMLPLLASSSATAVRLAAAHASSIDVRLPATVVALAFVPAVCAGAGATAASFAQTGGLHVRGLSFALGKLAPVAGLKRMFGAEAAVGGVRALVAFAAVTAAVVPLSVHAIASASSAPSLAALASVTSGAMFATGFVAAGTGALFAFADYAIVRRRWLHSLKMTFEEIKRDAREQDGDPQAKSRRRNFHRTLARGGVARTAEASFVVVNPTHIAIALRYAPPAVAVPEILVRAADAVALDVRAIAERAGIPVLEDIPLARLLWANGEAGRPIPPEAFVAVAMIVAELG